MATPTNRKQQIVIDNFNAMTPWVRNFSTKSQFNYILTNRLDADYVNGDPLQYAALLKTYSTSSYYALAADSNIVDAVPDPSGTYDFFALAYSGNVYKVQFYGTSSNVVTMLAVNNNAGNALTYFNGNLVKSAPLGTNALSYAPISGTTWTTVAAPMPAGINCMVNYGEYVYVGGGADNRIFRVDSSFNVVYPGSGTGGLSLPFWLGAIQMENYINRYIAIAAGIKFFHDREFTENYIFLWDGVSLSYNYAIGVSGKILGMKTIRGSLYVLVTETDKSISLYVLSGITLKKVFTSATSFTSSRIDSSGNRLTDRPLFDLFGNVGIIGQAGTTGSGGLYLWKIDEKELSQFMLGGDKVVVGNYVSGLPTPPRIFIGSFTSLFQIALTPAGQTSFRTNTLPINGQVDSVEIYYDSPPTLTSTVYSTLRYEDENNAGSGLNSYKSLKNIDATHYDNNKYTILDVGIACKSAQLQVNSDITIRKVVINYEQSVNQ